MKLVLEGLGAQRGGRSLFRDLDITLPEGGGLLVLGPNGAGKSTLLRVLAGLLAPSEGRVVLVGGGEDYPVPAAAAQLLADADGLKETLSVRANLEFWRRYQGRPKGRVEDALQQVGLPGIAELPVEALSKGMRRRVAIARLLATDLPIWLLDEPTSGLDRSSAVRLAGLIAAHREAGGIVVAATHHDLPMAGAQTIDLGAGVAAGTETVT